MTDTSATPSTATDKVTRPWAFEETFVDAMASALVSRKFKDTEIYHLIQDLNSANRRAETPSEMAQTAAEFFGHLYNIGVEMNRENMKADRIVEPVPHFFTRFAQMSDEPLTGIDVTTIDAFLKKTRWLKKGDSDIERAVERSAGMVDRRGFLGIAAAMMAGAGVTALGAKHAINKGIEQKAMLDEEKKSNKELSQEKAKPAPNNERVAELEKKRDIRNKAIIEGAMDCAVSIIAPLAGITTMAFSAHVARKRINETDTTNRNAALNIPKQVETLLTQSNELLEYTLAQRRHQMITQGGGKGL